MHMFTASGIKWMAKDTWAGHKRDYQPGKTHLNLLKGPPLCRGKAGLGGSSLSQQPFLFQACEV